MSSRQIPVLVFSVLLSVGLAGCSQPANHAPDTPAGVLEVQIVPEGQIEANKEVAAEIMPVLEALFWGTIQDRSSLVQYVSVGCTTADGLGGPPKCAPGEAEGTVVEVFPVGEAEGHFVSPGEIDRTFEFTVDGLYAVYRPTPGVDPVEYWPVGEYALLFERQIYNILQPVTVFVQDGRLVRLEFSSFPVDPAQLLSAIPLERILIPPEEARALTEQIKTPAELRGPCRS